MHVTCGVVLNDLPREHLHSVRLGPEDGLSFQIPDSPDGSEAARIVNAALLPVKDWPLLASG
jgi:hypothetical protein